MKVAAVVVTYNRKKLLVECINSLINQTRPPDAIYIIDGPSTDGTPEELKTHGYIEKLPPEKYEEYSWQTNNSINVKEDFSINLQYVRLYEDVGGAGGFYEGIKRAYETGYDWIWVMDDDAEPHLDALEKLIKYTNLPDVVALKNFVVDPKGNPQEYHWDPNYSFILKVPFHINTYEHNFVDVPYGSFVGLLINAKTIKKIKYPKKELFIYHDDFEYSLRLKYFGKIYLIPDSIIIHKGDPPHTKKRKDNPYFWFKTYISIRNKVYIVKEYYWNKRNKIEVVYYLAKQYLYETLKNRPSNVPFLKWAIYIMRAYADGIFEIFDNEKTKRIIIQRRV